MLHIQIINPAVKARATLTMRDVITVPVGYQRGTFRALDMIDNESALNLMRVYNRNKAV